MLSSASLAMGTIGTLTLVFLQFVTHTKGDCSFYCEALNCPCDCFRDEIRCFNKSVHSIGKFPERTRFKYLDFGNNNIEELKQDLFRGSNLKRMKVLQLASNRIHSIEDKTFAALHHLASLHLSSNNIRHLNRDTFYGLSALKRLYLDGNQIHVIHRQDFKHISQTLHLLYLQSNKITSIAPSAFENMRELRTLDLSGNQISTMDGRFLEKTLKLNHLFWSLNPWNCDDVTVCFTTGILERRTGFDGGIVLHDAMICQTPAEHRDKMASKLLDMHECENVTWQEPIANQHGHKGNDANRTTKGAFLLGACCCVWLVIEAALITGETWSFNFLH